MHKPTLERRVRSQRAVLHRRDERRTGWRPNGLAPDLWLRPPSSGDRRYTIVITWALNAPKPVRQRSDVGDRISRIERRSVELDGERDMAAVDAGDPRDTR